MEALIGFGTVFLHGPRSEKGAKILSVVSIMTCYKTCIYFLMEIVAGMENLSHNPLGIKVLVTFLSLPWLVCPALLSKTILQRLHSKEKFA